MLTTLASARLKAEGSASPADVILLVDAARLYRGEVDGPVPAYSLLGAGKRHPANLRAQPTAGWWHCLVWPLDPGA